MVMQLKPRWTRSISIFPHHTFHMDKDSGGFSKPAVKAQKINPSPIFSPHCNTESAKRQVSNYWPSTPTWAAATALRKDNLGHCKWPMCSAAWDSYRTRPRQESELSTCSTSWEWCFPLLSPLMSVLQTVFPWKPWKVLNKNLKCASAAFFSFWVGEEIYPSKCWLHCRHW